MNGSSPGAQPPNQASDPAHSSTTQHQQLSGTPGAFELASPSALRLPIVSVSGWPSGLPSTAEMLRSSAGHSSAVQGHGGAGSGAGAGMYHSAVSTQSTNTTFSAAQQFPYNTEAATRLLASQIAASAAMQHPFQQRGTGPGNAVTAAGLAAAAGHHYHHPVLANPYQLYPPLNRNLYLDAYINALPPRLRHLLPTSSSPRLHATGGPTNMPPPAPVHMSQLERSQSESDTFLQWRQHTQKQQQAIALATMKSGLHRPSLFMNPAHELAATSSHPQVSSTSDPHSEHSSSQQSLGAHAVRQLVGPASNRPSTTQHAAAPATSTPGTATSQPYYPSHFMRGTIIQLGNGELKRVEDLNTEDFIRSANLSSELKMDSSQVVRIEEKSTDTVLLCFSVGKQKLQVSVEATVEHPFYVIGQGWSSFTPERTRTLYGLPCQKMQVGDICISLTHRDVPAVTPTVSGVTVTGSSTVGTTSTVTTEHSTTASTGTSTQGMPRSTTVSATTNRPARHDSASRSSPDSGKKSVEKRKSSDALGDRTSSDSPATVSQSTSGDKNERKRSCSPASNDEAKQPRRVRSAS